MKLLRFRASLFSLVTTLAAQPVVPANADFARVMRLEHFVVPEFPASLRRTGVVSGTVVAAISPDGLGKADDILVLESSDPHFTAAATDAIHAWRFATHGRPDAPGETLVPVVRFVFTSANVSVVPAALGNTGMKSTSDRADAPIELPTFAHLDARPKPREHPIPAFPAEMQGKYTSGFALVKFFVDTDGHARLPVAITASDPAFASAAVSTVKQWRFEPPRFEGKPVIALETQTFRFVAPLRPPPEGIR